MDSTGKRFAGFDLMRGMAAFLIVGCHLPISTTESGAAVLRYCLSAVGVFAALSGFLLAMAIEKATGDHPVRTVAWRRVARLLPVQLVWTAIYLVALSLLDLAIGVPRGYLDGLGVKSIAVAFLRGSAEVHLWFIPSLLYASLIVVVADHLLPKALRSGIAYAAAAVAVLACSVCIDARFANYDLRLLSFLLLGVGLFRLTAGGGSAVRMAHRVAPIALLAALAGFLLLFGRVHRYILDFAVAVPALLAFGAPGFPPSRIGAFLSRTSLTVYLVHPFVARVVAAAGRYGTEKADALHTLMFWMLVYAVSLAIAWLIAKASALSHGAKRGNE